MARYYNSLRMVTRFLSSPSLLPRSNYVRNNLFPTGISRVSYSHSSWIPRCSYSVCLDLQKETSRSATVAALDSVVKIYTVSSTPNVVQPWQRDEEEESTGSGFVISKEKILTNAHVVENHSYVQVRKHGSSTAYKAKVEAVGHECDLAILVIDNKEFWEDMDPLELGDLPFINEEVSVLGYPKGGDTISVTKGIVSRIEPTNYVHSSTELLSIQIDAAINKGNSGGPVVIGNKVAGVAFQGLTRSENIGYIIPTQVVKHFLSCSEESGAFVCFGSLDISCQRMVDAQLRKLFQMDHTMTGILINAINPLSDAHKFLKKDDVILAIDGVPMGNDAKVPFKGKERISYNHLVSMKKPSETALLKVLRDGREHEFNISLKPVQRLIPVHQPDPSYYILAGFVFVPLSEPYIDDDLSDDICECEVEKRMPKTAGEQIIVISQVLSDDINRAYSDFKKSQVKKVNGVEVVNLKHLRDLIEDCCIELLRLDFEDDRVVALNFTSAKEATSLILERHGIRSAMSKDLQKEPTTKLSTD